MTIAQRYGRRYIGLEFCGQVRFPHSVKIIIMQSKLKLDVTLEYSARMHRIDNVRRTLK